MRDRRVRPGLDDKRLTSWNALAIAALAEAGAVLERDDFLDAAGAAADFLLRELQTDDGRVRRSWKDGRATLAGYLEDHAYLTEALLTLYEATLEPRWFAAARRLADVTIAHFGDDEQGGFFQTADDHEQLVARRKELEDTPIPSGQSAIALALLRLSRLTGEAEYERRAEGVIALLHPLAAAHPQAFPHLLRAIAFQQAEVHEVAVVGPAASAAAVADGARALPPARRAGWRARRRRDRRRGRPRAARGPHRDRRPRRRLRLRALQLPATGDRRRRARRAAQLTSALLWQEPWLMLARGSSRSLSRCRARSRSRRRSPRPGSWRPRRGCTSRRCSRTSARTPPSTTRRR